MQPLNQVDPKVLGVRLIEARKARGITQQDAAAFLGCSRPTLIAIEKGERPPKPDELVKLAEYYGRTVHELVRAGEAVTDLQPHLRAVADKMQLGDGELQQAITELQRLAEDYRELERLMNAPLKYNYPPQIELTSRMDVVALAEDVATKERQRLGLGDQPVLQLRQLLEWNVGLRIFYQRLPSALAGMYAFADEIGGVILINQNHPAVRRRASLMHEYGHLIVDRYKPGIDYVSHPGRKPINERFAESFAMGFLMPASSVRHQFHEIVATTKDFQVADLVRLSHFYFVSVEAMALRLEGFGLIPRGTSKMLLHENRMPVQKAKEALKLADHNVSAEIYPERYKYLAVLAYERAEITQGELARFLRCDPVTARDTVTNCQTSRGITDAGEVFELRHDVQRSLLSETAE